MDLNLPPQDDVRFALIDAADYVDVLMRKASLSNDEKEVLFQVFYKGESMRDVAEKMKQNEMTLRRLFQNTILKLRVESRRLR